MNLKLRTCLIGTFVLCAGLAMSSCGASDTPLERTGAPRNLQECPVSGLPDEIAEDLCDPNPARLAKRLAQISPEPGDPIRTQILGILSTSGVIFGQATGSSIEGSVQGVATRLIVGEYLAQGVRNREVEADLAPIQSLAARIAAESSDEENQLMAIRLLGISDSSNDVGLLENLAAAESGSNRQQDYAIEALGYICAGDATEALRRLKIKFSQRSDLVETVNRVEALRDRLTGTWCERQTIEWQEPAQE